MPMSDASGMKEALREVVGKEIMVVVISQCKSGKGKQAEKVRDMPKSREDRRL